MDMNLTVAIVVIIFALVVVAAFVIFQQRARVKIKGPGDTGLELDASNDPKPAAQIGKAKSHAGNVLAEDKTGRGAAIDEAEAWGDISARSTPSPSDPDPKA